MNEAQKATNSEKSLVTFRLGPQTYALPIEPLVQIVEMVSITPIPQVNSSVEGVINLRGAAVPVVNLGRHFGLPDTSLLLHTPIILVRTGDGTIGLIVDEVLDVLRVSGAQILGTADILPEGLGKLPVLQGVVHTSNGTLFLLAPEHLFCSDHGQALAQAMATLPQTSTQKAGEGKTPKKHRETEAEGQHDC